MRRVLTGVLHTPAYNFFLSYYALVPYSGLED